jgi:hypothetical protein
MSHPDAWLAQLGLPWNLRPVLAALQATPHPTVDPVLGPVILLHLRRRTERTSFDLFPSRETVRVQMDGDQFDFQYTGTPEVLADSVVFAGREGGRAAASLALMRTGNVGVIRTLQPPLGMTGR